MARVPVLDNLAVVEIQGEILISTPYRTSLVGLVQPDISIPEARKANALRAKELTIEAHKAGRNTSYGVVHNRKMYKTKPCLDDIYNKLVCTFSYKDGELQSSGTGPWAEF